MSKEAAEKVEVCADKSKYVTTRNASGKKSLSNGDDVAVAMAGLNIDEVFILGTKFLGEDFTDKYAHLNAGMQRMSIGNRIRAKIKKLDAANDKAEEEGKKVGLPGVDQFNKAVAPLQREVAKRDKLAEKEKAAADKEKVAAKAEKGKKAA